MNKLDNVKNKTTQEQLSDARNLLEKWANPPLTRKVERKSNDGMHRTMIKTDHGIRRGVVEKVTAFPLGLYNILERKDVGSRAQQILEGGVTVHGTLSRTSKSPPHPSVLSNMLSTLTLILCFWSAAVSTV